MNADERIVIVGGGQAGGELAWTLRQLGHKGTIVLLGDEEHLPYRRPPLSKAYLLGSATRESLYLRPEADYAGIGVNCFVGRRAERIDRARREVVCADGMCFPYDKLVLATGGRPRRLAMEGADLPNVHYVRTIEDVDRLRAQFLAGARLAVIGGGYVGLEAASAAIQQGMHVTVIEALPRLLSRVMAPEMSAFYECLHRAHGVNVLVNTGVAGFEVSANGAEDRVAAVRLDNGGSSACDLVVVGIGMQPNTELAESAGLCVGNGIVVDAFLRTSDPDVLAMGDCCEHENVFLGQRLRLESVPNAIEQAKAAAASLVGRPAPFQAVPWFWSDQFDIKLQKVGLPLGYDHVVIRGDMGAGGFIAFYISGDTVVAADAVNSMQEFPWAKRLVGERMTIDPTNLTDRSVSLKSLFLTA